MAECAGLEGLCERIAICAVNDDEACPGITADGYAATYENCLAGDGLEGLAPALCTVACPALLQSASMNADFAMACME